ncbi:MAG: TIGR03667 family PPOX class F420-dependent oxidoreductase [Chloroflexota bacterium]|nr:TIGR03667 family PPOX class F420-dependent oxidoreductase [Chloroflexota bacterium]
MSITFDEQQSAMIARAEYLWFTTLRADGQPQPTPVWFIYENDTFLIFSQPDAQKVKNIRSNPKVALNYSVDPQGETYIVIMGEAEILDTGLSVTQVSAYVDKYRQGIADLDMTPESMAASYSTAIRVTPTRVRSQ